MQRRHLAERKKPFSLTNHLQKLLRDMEQNYGFENMTNEKMRMIMENWGMIAILERDKFAQREMFVWNEHRIQTAIARQQKYCVRPTSHGRMRATIQNVRERAALAKPPREEAFAAEAVLDSGYTTANTTAHLPQFAAASMKTSSTYFDDEDPETRMDPETERAYWDLLSSGHAVEILQEPDDHLIWHEQSLECEMVLMKHDPRTGQQFPYLMQGQNLRDDCKCTPQKMTEQEKRDKRRMDRENFNEWMQEAMQRQAFLQERAERTGRTTEQQNRFSSQQEDHDMLGGYYPSRRTCGRSFLARSSRSCVDERDQEDQWMRPQELVPPVA
ncbi:unnamed protein product [Amoebophrya sp. A120]|nr:unnamed protein product [Amoebophrya sp. A120]|eukprot:GSA120T00008348001.1